MRAARRPWLEVRLSVIEIFASPFHTGKEEEEASRHPDPDAVSSGKLWIPPDSLIIQDLGVTIQL